MIFYYSTRNGVYKNKLGISLRKNDDGWWLNQILLFICQCSERIWRQNSTKTIFSVVVVINLYCGHKFTQCQLVNKVEFFHLIQKSLNVRMDRWLSIFCLNSGSYYKKKYETSYKKSIYHMIVYLKVVNSGPNIISK